MRLRVLSDIHAEVAPFDPPPLDADLVVLAGDIHNGEQAPRWARAAFRDSRILMVPGNHEFYGGERAGTLERMRAAARECEVHLLENEALVLDGVRFLGCTLWTDFRLFEAPGRPLSMDAVQAASANRRLIADFFAIRVADGPAVRAFAAHDAIALHERSRGWLEGALSSSWGGPTVVVSHHLPSWRSVHPAYASWVTNAAFASDLDALVAGADLWIHGHTHTTMRYRLGATEVVCNPRGYPRYASLDPARGDRPGGGEAERRPVGFENPLFDPALIVEVPVR